MNSKKVVKCCLYLGSVRYYEIIEKESRERMQDLCGST